MLVVVQLFNIVVYDLITKNYIRTGAQPNSLLTGSSIFVYEGASTSKHLDCVFYFYRPQRSCGKVMFLHLSVILSTGGGGCLADTPSADTPLGRQPLGRHPQTETPQADTPP